MNYCKTCKHWERAGLDDFDAYVKTEGFLTGGFCGSEKWYEGSPLEYPQDAMIYPYWEGGSFWTGPNFGCVHHEPKP